MAECENNSNEDDKDNADLVKIIGLGNRLDACTSSSKQSPNTSEINTILNALNNYLTNPAIRNRLISNKQIVERKLTSIFNHFCKISIRFSSSLPNYPLFMTVMIPMWNMIYSKFGEPIEKRIVSAQEYYITAMVGLETDQFSMYLSGNSVQNIYKFYVKILLKLAKTVIWSDARRMENLNLSDYTAHKCLHEEKYDAVFYKMITFIDYCFTDTETDTSRNECAEIIFSLIVVLSDSKSLLPTTIRIGFPAKLVE